MPETNSYQGGCSCGKLRFRMNAAPLITHACHCHQCQRVTGSAFVLNALIEKSAVTLLSGNIAEVRFPNTSHTAHYCPDCATYVWSAYNDGRLGNCWFVRVGVLDEAHRLPPNVHIFTESKQPWVLIPEDTPQFERFYNIQKVWPQESLARMAHHWSEPQ